MASVSIYLNYMGNAEEAFNLYKKVFGTEFSTPPMRMKDMPPREGAPVIAEADKNKIMHMALPILGGIQIMATDMLASMGQELVEGNNFTISLNPDTKEEADRLYKGLCAGGSDEVVPHDEFWGYWGTCKDRFGIRWMFNVMK
jgi:PhnB protein